MFRWLANLFADTFEGRSPQWPKVRAKFLVHNPSCVVCGATEDIEVHHLRPVNAYPELELSLANLRTVCHDCHLLVGHCRDTRSWNPQFDADAAFLSRMIARRKYGRLAA